MKLLLDKTSKIPLYLQLRDSIKYYISTGDIQFGQKLPTVLGLAAELEVNFETVRKAYKELEREGLLSSKRGLGTFVNGRGASLASGLELHPAQGSAETAKRSIKVLLQSGMSPDSLKRWIDDIHAQRLCEAGKRFVIFSECNSKQAHEIASELKIHLGLAVKPLLIHELKDWFDKETALLGRPVAVVTTGFHLNEVRTIVANHHLPVEFVITNMSQETRRGIEALPRTSRFAFICRDPESIGIYKDTLKAELAIEGPLPFCTLAESQEVTKLIQENDVLLVTPGAYDGVKKLAPRKMPIFNVIDHVDPISVQVVKTRILNIQTGVAKVNPVRH